MLCFFFKQKTAYEMRISDWSSDVCSSDLLGDEAGAVIGPDVGRFGIGIGSRATACELPADEKRAGYNKQTAGLEPISGQEDRIEIGRASCRERVCQYG